MNRKACSVASRASVAIFTAFAAVTLVSAQAPPPPGAQFPPGQLPPPPPQTGPQLSGCVGSDGKLLPMVMDLNLVATATGPFSIDLNWSGPPAVYRVTGPGLSVDVATNATVATLETASPVQRMSGRAPAGGLTSPTQPAVVNGSFPFARPQFPVLPNYDYGFEVRATLPDGRIVCDIAGAKTPQALISALPSAFFAPGDIRLGFVMPPYAQELNVYRENYIEDGRYAPIVKRVLQEPLPSPSSVPVTYGVKGTGKTATDYRKRINPGLPPVPTDYTRPPAYDLTVEVVWRDGPSRSSITRTVIRVDGPLPLLGWADLHTHPMSHLAFGSKVFHGAPDAGSLLPALSIPATQALGRNDCLVQPGRRAANMNEALQEDSPTHGDFTQSLCGDGVRRALIFGIETAAETGMPPPGRRLGAPVFDAWPAWNDVTHQKMWVDWIRRAYDGGLRVMVALSHNNRVLGELAKGNCGDPARPCWIPTNDQASSDMQIMEIKEFVKRNADFMEVALNSADVYRIVRGNPAQKMPPKIAVVLGIEIDNIGNFCPEPPPPQFKSDPSFCKRATSADITNELKRLYSQGVRYIFPVHVTDNLFGGTAPYNPIFDAANVYETGHFWDVECAGTQPFPDDEIGFEAPDLTSVDNFLKSIPAPFSSVIPKGIELPMTPQNCARPAHRNKKGLTGVGMFAVKEMMRLGFIIDVDHMSHRTVESVLSIAEGVEGGGYPLMSGHSAVRDPVHFKAENSRTRSQLGRIGCLGGMFGLGADHAEPRQWAIEYQDAQDVIRWRTPQCLYKEIGVGAVALGSDVNSMVQSPKPLLEIADQQDPDRRLNVYGSVLKNERGTFTRFPTSPSTTLGTTWDYRVHGVAHYGMFADFIKAVWSFPFEQKRGMRVSGQELVEGHLDRNADNFWRMWVKVEQQKGRVKH
jgi:hypothetical protein